jgi:hypothetical protein
MGKTGQCPCGAGALARVSGAELIPRLRKSAKSDDWQARINVRTLGVFGLIAVGGRACPSSRNPTPLSYAWSGWVSDASSREHAGEGARATRVQFRTHCMPPAHCGLAPLVLGCLYSKGLPAHSGDSTGAGQHLIF